MARSFIVYQGEDETPEYDLTEPDSDVHVIWEEIEAGGRAFQGESTTNSIPIRDEQAETGNSQDLPSGMELTSLSRGSRWVWMDGPDGDEVIMASGRIGTKDYSRGRQKADRAREVTIQAADRNEELTEIIIDDWVRPEETDVARVNALITAYLNGSPRVTTVLSNTYVSSANTVTMPAKTYDGTNPKDVLNEVALQANKLFFVTVDDEVFYDVATSTVYQAGIRISDRLEDLDTEASCSSGIAVVQAVESVTGDSVDQQLVLEVPEGLANGAIYLFVHSDSTGPFDGPTWLPTGLSDPAPNQALSLIHSTDRTASGSMAANKLQIWRLLDPLPSDPDSPAVDSHIAFSSGHHIAGAFLLSGVDQSSPNETPVGNTGSGTTSSITLTTDGDQLALNAASWRVDNQNPSAGPTAGGGQTQGWSRFHESSFGNSDLEQGGGYGSSAPTWTFNSSQPWSAVGVVVNPATGSSGATFPPIWDVGPSSTEDGLELVSGLRLYYGQDGAYVYVNHAGTAAEYWWAERSFYTQDPAIDDSTKATALAEAMLTRLRFEERTYNVSIGPLNEEQVGCIKYGQLIQIKARAIPDADDQFRARRIAQLKWTTPRPGVFFARMQLDRPIKELPYGIGAKQGHDALEAHKEGDSHPASAIVVVPFGTIAATDVQAALEEIVAEATGTDDQTAAEVSYDNTSSGLTADDVQDAIDELAADSGATPVPLTPFDQHDVLRGYNLTKQGIVIERGASSSWKEALVESPNVFWSPEAGKYVMVFVGYSGTPASPTEGALGVATADSPDGPWTEYATNPFFEKSGAGDDSHGTSGPFVWYEDETYHLYYIGLTSSGYEAGTKTICHATSTDWVPGTNDGTWTRNGAIIEPSGSGWRDTDIWHPNIVKRGSTYYLFFNAGDGTSESIGYATSTDLATWTVDDVNSPVLEKGSGGAWDDSHVGDPYLYRVGETWYMAYFGFDGTNASDGLAFTSDADFPLGWTKFADNPVLTYGGSDDSKHAHKPAIWITPTKHYHWYTAVTTASPEKREIALATEELVAGGATDLDDLTDVAITSPEADQQLQYVGGTWVNNHRRWEPVVTDPGTGPELVFDGTGDIVMTWADYS